MIKAFLSQYSKILGLSKIIRNILILFFLCSCSFFEDKAEIERFAIASEIICPNNTRYMIRYAHKDEVRMAIQRDYYRKIREDSNESFTVIRIPNIESFHIEKAKPEELINCDIIESYIPNIYPSYIRSFKKKS